MLVIASIMAFWLGFRPIDGGYGDTYGYAIVYDRGISYGNSGEDEWGFGMIMDYCRPFFDASWLFCYHLAFGVFLMYGFCNEETPEWKCLWWISDFSGGLFYFFVCD